MRSAEPGKPLFAFTSFTFETYFSPSEIVRNLSKNSSSNKYSECLNGDRVLHFFGVIANVIELKRKRCYTETRLFLYLDLDRFKLIIENRSAARTVFQSIVLVASVDNCAVAADDVWVGS